VGDLKHRECELVAGLVAASVLGITVLVMWLAW